MTERTKVAVLMGGVSGEHDVSLKSGSGVLKNLDPDKYAGVKVVILKDGSWSIADAPGEPMLDALRRLKAEIDVVFIALHGPNGEDGTMQSLFHLLRIPYTGPDYYASSLAMNKPRTKDVYLAAGLDVAADVVISSTELAADPGGQARRLLEALGLPMVVKTTKLGSSVGVQIVENEDELHRALAEVMAYNGQLLAEQFIAGTEVTSPVIDNPYSGETVALPLIEIRPVVSGWFDYDAKYKKGGADEICPAPIAGHLTKRCKEIGLAAHHRLGCRGMSRTDMIIDAEERIFVIETNTIPGFTPTSLLPQAAEEAGISYSQLVDMLIQETLQRSTSTAD